MQDGKGTFTWANGAVYEGDWKTTNVKAKVLTNGATEMCTKATGRDNRPHGQGSLKTVAGMQYKGGFVDGLEEGQGVQIDKDGNRFEGFFKQGKKRWSFVETDKDGKVIKKEPIRWEEFFKMRNEELVAHSHSFLVQFLVFDII